jgi:hypothetical protein
LFLLWQGVSVVFSQHFSQSIATENIKILVVVEGFKERISGSELVLFNPKNQVRSKIHVQKRHQELFLPSFSRFRDLLTQLGINAAQYSVQELQHLLRDGETVHLFIDP